MSQYVQFDGSMTTTVELVLDMQQQAVIAAAVGLTVGQEVWLFQLGVLAAVAKQLEPAALNEKLKQVANTLPAGYDGAGRGYLNDFIDNHHNYTLKPEHNYTLNTTTSPSNNSYSPPRVPRNN